MRCHFVDLKRIFLLANLVLLLSGVATAAFGEPSPGRVPSLHAGFLYPNGVDIFGYTVEHAIEKKIYGFYTFGIPAFAAAGVSYYADYTGNGLSATLGVGIGSILYTSVVYQLRLADRHFMKVGGGYTTGVAYAGLYPALSYEFRFY